MLKIDSNKCTGCGACAGVCPHGAISIENSIAMIDQKLCTQCGDCAVTCPADAVYALEPGSQRTHNQQTVQEVSRREVTLCHTDMDMGQASASGALLHHGLTLAEGEEGYHGASTQGWAERL